MKTMLGEMIAGVIIAEAPGVNAESQKELSGFWIAKTEDSLKIQREFRWFFQWVRRVVSVRVGKELS